MGESPVRLDVALILTYFIIDPFVELKAELLEIIFSFGKYEDLSGK